MSETFTDLKKARRQKSASNGNGAIDRLPPNDPLAEQAVLACVFLAPKECLPQCIERFSAAAVFYDLRNQTIYECFVELFEDGIGIDVITVQQRLKAFAKLEQVGGIAYLAALPDAVPSAANIEYYLDIVEEKFTLRKMVITCTEAVGRIYDFEGEVDTLVDEVERDILRIGENRVRSGVVPIVQLVRESVSDIERMWQGGGEVTGMATGFSDFDKMTGGLQPGTMVVIAARPSMGKSSLAMNIADFVSVQNKIPVGVFSLEMRNRALTTRMICARARVNIRNVRDGFLAERDFPKLTTAAGAISGAPLYIDDSSGLSILQLRAKARRMWQQYDLKLILIDYLQLMNAIGGKRKFESRQQEVADISAGTKALAKELDIPIIILSQLNRELDKEKRKPRLSDLRESGAIEQDADVVGFLYRPAKQEDEDDFEGEAEAVPVNLLIAKQREGPTGDVNLTFLKSYTRFESAGRVSDSDVPVGYRSSEPPEQTPLNV